MENNHTVAIAILQDDHHLKVQGSYRPPYVRPFGVGRVSPTFPAILLLVLLFPFSLPFLPVCLPCRFLWKEELEIQDPSR